MKTIVSIFFVLLVVVPGLRAQPGRSVKLKIEENEHWWGGAVVDGSLMPFGRAEYYYNQYADTRGNQAQPLLISSTGRYVWSEKPLVIRFTHDSLTVYSDFAPVEQGRAGSTLREAYLYVSRHFFPADGRLPDSLLFASPQYNTWIELQYNQNQEDILAYARAILDNGFPSGVLMIDDNWQTDYGVWDFSPLRFSDPKAMIDSLHALGFKVMLWVCPFVSPDSEVYRELAVRGLLVFEDSARTRPAIVRWWNGASALLDLSNPAGAEWYAGQLDRLQRQYGVDGFKLDAGDAGFYSGVYAHRDILPNEHTGLHAAVGLQYPLNEYRASWKMAGRPLAQRLRDKEHTWEHLRALIPDILAQGLMGYAFTCPDMIGGGEVESFTDSTVLDQELIVRSAQCHALMPMMQFSVAPWRVLDSVHLAITRSMALLHNQMGSEILALAWKAARTGEPVVRPLEYVFPHMGYHGISDQFMLGDSILVAPVVEKGTRSRTVVLPLGLWQGDDGSRVKGPARITIEVPLKRLPRFKKIR